MNLANLSLLKVGAATVFKPFDCGDEDLNNFFIEKSKHYKKELLATTYLLENKERTIAFFSLFNDSLRVQKEDFASTSAFKRMLQDIVTHPKRHLKYFPALKIGRLGVCSQTQNCGIGKFIIDFIIDLAIKQNEECACKLITVDAYAESFGFYERKGFKFLTDNDKNKDTRQMFLDITPYLYLN
jgi:hypothetical protein